MPTRRAPTCWNVELRPSPRFEVGMFGENLMVAGWLEEQVFIGDVWSWGDALLQVTQPRIPCYKLAIVTGRQDMLGRLVETGRTGWYLRVLRPGDVPVAGPILLTERGHESVTVLDALRASMPGAPREAVERVAAVATLARAWHGWLSGN